MAGGVSRNMALGLIAVASVLLAVYIIDPSFGGLLRRMDGFTSTLSSAGLGNKSADFPGASGNANRAAVMNNPNVAQGPDMGGYDSTGCLL